MTSFNGTACGSAGCERGPHGLKEHFRVSHGERAADGVFEGSSAQKLAEFVQFADALHRCGGLRGPVGRGVVRNSPDAAIGATDQRLWAVQQQRKSFKLDRGRRVQAVWQR